VHVIDMSAESGRNPVDDLEVIRRELASYRVSPVESTGQALADKPQLVAANKIDVVADPDALSRLRERLAGLDIPLYPVSAVTGEGLRPLLEAMWNAVHSAESALLSHAAGGDE
jgi:GTP-binding protein